jgi:DNA-binding MarR family transcriptional regulator
MTSKDELPLVLRTAYLILHRRSDAAFAEHGITADQFVLLANLARGQAITQRELAARMPSDPSTVRAMLVLLEKQGNSSNGCSSAHGEPDESRRSNLSAGV